jgi:hypothetical protein
MPFTHFALFIIFIEHQFKKVLKQNFVLFLLGYDHAFAHSIYLVEKRKKMTQQLKGEKYEYLA